MISTRNCGFPCPTDTRSHDQRLRRGYCIHFSNSMTSVAWCCPIFCIESQSNRSVELGSVHYLTVARRRTLHCISVNYYADQHDKGRESFGRRWSTMSLPLLPMIFCRVFLLTCVFSYFIVCHRQYLVAFGLSDIAVFQQDNNLNDHDIATNYISIRKRKNSTMK